MSTDRQPDDNSYIMDTSNGAELDRLTYQDRLVTQTMGGLFPERNDVSTMHDMLDIACGPGGWAIDVALSYPDLHIVGIDSNAETLNYARALARMRKLNNVSFSVMDALKPLDFPDNSFDLVNARFLVGFMPKTAWPVLLRECLRIIRPGGVIRLTEFDEPGTTNSPAFAQWNAMTFGATQAAGLTCAPDGHNFGITPVLGHLLRETGYQNVHHQAHALDFSFEADEYHSMYQNCQIAFHLVQPFLIKMRVGTPEKIDQLYQQVLQDMLSNDFCALWYFLTVWGQKSL